MSQLTTEDMSRVVVAGTRGQLKTAVEVAAGLAMIHINDFSGDEDGQQQNQNLLLETISLSPNPN